jgi:hypothetical protein
LDVAGVFGRGSPALRSLHGIPVFSSGQKSAVTYKKIATLPPSVTDTTGHLRILLDLSGWQRSQGKCSIECIVSNRDTLLAVSKIFGLRANFDIEVYLDSSGNHVIYAVAGATFIAQSQMQFQDVGYLGGLQVDALSSIETTATPSGTLVYKASTATSTTVVTDDGDVLIGTTTDNTVDKLQVAGSIKLGNTAVASSTSLDWYEEGTFTPVIVGTATAGTGTYSIQYGSYTRIGNRVSFQLQVVSTGHTGTGEFVISGLPFTHIGTANSHSSCSIGWVSLTTFTGQLLAYILASTNRIVFRQAVSNTVVTAMPMDSTAGFMISGTYQV